MTTIDGSMSLASLVDAHPGLASAFERHQLDYCCGGHRSLAVACAERGLDPLVVLGDLATVEAPGDVGDWTTMAAAALCDHLT